MKTKAILSFDYELFFGENSGTIEYSIIKPTELLLSCMEENKFHGNFFVDYLMFKKLEEQTDEISNNDVRLLKKQVKEIVRKGHRIELHLHPHWLDAQYLGQGKWDFSNYQHYSLSSLDEETIIDMFVSGKIYLEKLVREIEPNYEIIAFRAGGWAVQPFDLLKEGFINARIKIDSSVSYKIYGKNQFSFFDFLNAPSKSYWDFEDDVCIPVSDGAFREVPISSYHRGFIYRVFDFIERKFTKELQPITDGTHRRRDLIEELSPTPINSMYTISRLSSISVFLAALLNKKQLVTYIDHPKDYSPSVRLSMKMLRFFYDTIFYKDLIKA